MTVSKKVETTAYQTAKLAPEVFYSLKEKHFFQGFYNLLERPTTHVDGIDMRLTAKHLVAYMDEALMLGRLNRKFFRQHCDILGQEHIDVLPKRIFKKNELSHVLSEFNRS